MDGFDGIVSKIRDSNKVFDLFGFMKSLRIFDKLSLFCFPANYLTFIIQNRIDSEINLF